MDDATIDEFVFELRAFLVNFFGGEYLHILESAQYHIIYSHDTRRESAIRSAELHEDADGSWWSLEAKDSSGASSRETILRTKMYEFDQVIAISQGSINAQFAALQANIQSLFFRWEYESYFSTSFKPMTVRLLSNERVIVWIHMKSGNLKTLSNSQPDERCVSTSQFDTSAHEFR